MANQYLEILNDKKINEFDFPTYYHNRGMMIKESGNTNNIPNVYLFDLVDGIDIKKIKKEVASLIIDERSFQIFWYLNAVEVSGHSVLDEFSPLFMETNKVTRGGINTYKLNGWMVHVLYVYQIVTYNIPYGIPPKSFSNDIIQNTFSELEKVYKLLTPSFRVILKIYALIHDIGVVDGVQHHDVDGEKYVKQVLNDLELTDSFWRKYNFTLQDAIAILQVLVANHTLINKISGEESDLSIKDRCDGIKLKLKNTTKIINYSNLAICYYLLGIADLIAVDDSLYTLKKYTLVYGSYQYLESIFVGRPIMRNKEEVALLRLSEMVHETTYNDIALDTRIILQKNNMDYSEFCEGLFWTYHIEYATAFLKPLCNLEYVILILSKLINYVRTFFGTEKLTHLNIIFNSAIDNVKLKKGIENGEFINLIDQLNRNILCVKSHNLDITYVLQDNTFYITTNTYKVK